MKDLFLLIKYRFLGFKNQILRSEKGKRNRTYLMTLLGVAFLAGLFVISCRVLTHFQSVEMLGDLLARYLLGTVLLTLFSLLIFSHVITGLSNLYLSSDLELCHSSPVSLEDLFLSRAFYTLIDSSWMLLIFGLPVFMAYAYVYRPGPGFFFTLLHLNLAMAIIAAGIGILLTMALVRLFPARGARDIMMLLAIIMVVGLYILFRFLRPERLVDPEAFFTVAQYLDSLKVTDSRYLPTHWITETLWSELTDPGRMSNLFNILLVWTTAGALVVINVWVAGAIYFDGFSRSQESKRKRKGSRVLGPFIDRLTRPFGLDLAAIMAKDVRTFFRDHTQWPQLLLLGALVVVYLYNFSALPLDKSPIRLDFLQNELAFLNMGLAGFVLSAVSARFVYTSISAEGEAYWIIRSSPLELRRFLWGKYLLFLLPMLVLAEVLIVLTNYLLGVAPLMMALSAGTMFIMVFGVVSLGIGFGAIYPDFMHRNIAQVSTGFGGVLYMIVSTLFIGVVVVLEAGPVYILVTASNGGGPIVPWKWAFIFGSFFAAFLINVLAIYKPMKMGLKALAGHE